MTTLSFDEMGRLIGNSPKGSYTLSGIQIDKVRLTKHKVELDGQRYGLHFLGALPSEDPTKAVDRVKITPKKKFVQHHHRPRVGGCAQKTKAGEAEEQAEVRRAIVYPGQAKPKPGELGPPPNSNAQPTQAPATASPSTPATALAAAPNAPSGPPDEDQARAEMAAAPAAERPADPGSVTTTLSQGHANKVLKDALDHIFASGLDERMMAAMPDFWKLYYQAVAAKTDYRPSDPAVLRQNGVDQKAKLLSKFEPESNDFAQANGVAGMALYHAVIGVDGKPPESPSRAP